ncbi:hypothetical protein QQZ08_009817 [Neonectria magnoliae]|uniref:Enoyl reductase (ER) domain-containing protein n=1 Tax=Neonectria magnoliae TaxID=2732573 RepID=A0ABR1HLN8_9HYPO
MSSSPSSYKAVVVENVPWGEPSSEEVLVKVIAYGICHTDAIMQAGYLGNAFPHIPGHEIVGDIVKVGEGCQRGLHQMCENAKAHGVTVDGGFVEYMTVRAEAVFRVPRVMAPSEVAPLMCAGLTTFNGIRKMGVNPGSVVAVQFANRMGFKVVALSSGDSKKDFAKQLGAHQYIDTSTEDLIAALTALSGAALIAATAPNAKAILPLVQSPRPLGKLLVLAPVGNIDFDTTAVTRRSVSVHTWPSGNILDAEETLEFAKLHGTKCLIERFPLEDTDKAMGRMLSGTCQVQECFGHG